MFKHTLFIGMFFVVVSNTIHAEELYAEIGASFVDTNKIDNVAIGPIIRGGYLFKEESNSLGLEIEANPMSVKTQNTGNGHNNRDMAITLGTYLVYSFQIPDTPIRLRPRIGLVFPNLGENLYKDNNSVAFGMSGLYDINKMFSVFISYGNFGSSANQYSTGLSVRF